MNSQLCSQCLQVNLTELVEGAPDEPGSWDCSWDPTIINRATCPLCRLLYHCLLNHPDISESNLATGGIVEGSYVGHELLLTFYPKEGDTRLVRHSIHYHEALAEEENKNSTLFGSWLIETEPFTPRHLMEWLEKCTENHQACQHIVYILPPEGFRLVDTAQGCIVPGTADMSYLALSYVWGGITKLELTEQNSKVLECPGSLWARGALLPKTIVDAIALCQASCQRYLWVDSLCILQDGGRDKYQQIQVMDTIYSRATLTIIAAAGVDADSGLLPSPLAIGQTNTELLVDDIGGRTFVAMPSHERTVDGIERSPWASRGWTLQEEAMSRRKIYFAGDAVLYRCHGACWGTDFGLDADGHFSEHGVPEWAASLSTFPTAAIGDISKAEIIEAFSQHVSHYLPRQLTYPNDVLNAFQGILTRASRLGLKHTWGLPTMLLPSALLWKHETMVPHKPRDGFPSWSWAGWTFSRRGRRTGSYPAIFWGSKRKFSPLEACYGIDQDWKIVVLSTRNPDGMAVLMGNLEYPNSTRDVITHFTEPQEHLRQKILTEMAKSILTGGKQHSKISRGPNLQPLVMFWTSVARVRLVPQDLSEDLEHTYSAMGSGAPRAFNVRPFDSNTAEAPDLAYGNSVLLPVDLYKEQRGEFYAAVVDLDYENGDIYMRYGILVLKEKDGVFTRIQSAVIPSSDWNQCKPEQRLVSLV